MSTFTYQITPRAEHLGGGWRLQLLEGEREVGGSIYPVTEDVTSDDAHAEAFTDAEAWLSSRGVDAATPLGQHSRLTEDEITTIWRTMPGGPAGWLKSFGFLQFAREVEGAVLDANPTRQSPAPIPEQVAQGSGVEGLARYSSSRKYLGAVERDDAGAYVKFADVERILATEIAWRDATIVDLSGKLVDAESRLATQSAKQGAQPDLPALPEPWITNHSAPQPESREHYARDQMEEYGATCYAQGRDDAEFDHIRASMAREASATAAGAGSELDVAIARLSSFIEKHSDVLGPSGAAGAGSAQPLSETSLQSLCSASGSESAQPHTEGDERALPQFSISRFSDTKQRGVLVLFDRRLTDGELETVRAALDQGAQAAITASASDAPITTADEFFAEARRLGCKLPADVCEALARADAAQQGVSQAPLDVKVREGRVWLVNHFQSFELAYTGDPEALEKYASHLRVALARAPLPDDALLRRAAAVVARLYNEAPNTSDSIEAGDVIQYFLLYAGKARSAARAPLPAQGGERRRWQSRPMASVPHPHAPGMRVVGFTIPNSDQIVLPLECLTAIIGEAAPAQPVDDARDAARYRWIRSQESSLETQQRDMGIINGPSCYHEVEGIRELKWGAELDAAIDAAMRANDGAAEGGAK